MSETITLREYKPNMGFGVYSATGGDGSHFLIDMHIDGTTEPFASWADDTTTSDDEMETFCKSLEGKSFEIESRGAAMFYAKNGKML